MDEPAWPDVFESWQTPPNSKKGDYDVAFAHGGDLRSARALQTATLGAQRMAPSSINHKLTDGLSRKDTRSKIWQPSRCFVLGMSAAGKPQDGSARAGFVVGGVSWISVWVRACPAGLIQKEGCIGWSRNQGQPLPCSSSNNGLRQRASINLIGSPASSVLEARPA